MWLRMNLAIVYFCKAVNATKSADLETIRRIWIGGRGEALSISMLRAEDSAYGALSLATLNATYKKCA